MSRNYRSDSCPLFKQHQISAGQLSADSSSTEALYCLNSARRPKIPGWIVVGMGLIVAPWKFDVLRTSIFALEASLLGQIC